MQEIKALAYTNNKRVSDFVRDTLVDKVKTMVRIPEYSSSESEEVTEQELKDLGIL
jgi:hypothetical protein